MIRKSGFQQGFVHFGISRKFEIFASHIVKVASESAPFFAVRSASVKAVVLDLGIDGEKRYLILNKLGITKTNRPGFIFSIFPVVQHFETIGTAPPVEFSALLLNGIPILQFPIY